MKKVLINISGNGGEICGGVLSPEIQSALKNKKAVIQKYGEGIEYQGEVIPYFEIDNFAHTFGANIDKAKIEVIVDGKTTKIKAKEHANVSETRYCCPSIDQLEVGENTIIINYIKSKGDFGTYSFELANEDKFDAQKLLLGTCCFDEFGLEDDSFTFITDVFYGDIASSTFEEFIEKYCEISNSDEREKYVKSNLPASVINVLGTIEEEFNVQGQGKLRFIFNCKINKDKKFEEDFTLKQKINA